MDEPQAFLNGQWVPASTAGVPLYDAGFILGTTVAEQLRTFGGKIFRLHEHLARLQQSLRIIGVAPEITIEQMGRVAGELVARNHRLLAPGDDLGLSIFVTPGDYPAYAEPGESRPTVCLHTYPLPFRFWAEKYRIGESLATTDVQQVPPGCWPPGLKCRSRMHYYLADRKAAAIEPGARALMLDREGLVVEASTANVLVFTAGRGLISPPHQKILRGISLAVIFELAGRLEIPTADEELSPDDVAAADEVLLASTPMCLLPVTRFNGRAIGIGRPGEVFARLLSAWDRQVGLNIAGQACRFSRRI